MTISSCGTLTGVPGHGGGKRFSEEQRLVASSIRLSTKHLDVSSLRGKNVALVFGLIADEGGGNIVGGRASITAILTQGVVTVPMSQTRNGVDIFQLVTGSDSSTSSSSTGTSASDNETASGQTSNGTSTESSSSTSSGSSSTETGGATSSTSTETSNGSSNSSSDATTTSEFSTDANQTTSTTGTSASDTTVTTTTSGTSTGTNVGISETTNTGTSTGTNTNVTSGTSTTSTTGTNTATSFETGTTSGVSETAIVTSSDTTASGRQGEANIGITYEGLGQYQNLAVPKSDAAFLMSEVRNHFLLNGVQVRSPADPATEVFIYVSVLILGTNRSRTDLVVYNQESLRAETYIEIFGIDRRGKIILEPQVGNYQTFYKEDYIGWSGPYNTRRDAEAGLGLIGDSIETEASNVE